MHVGPEPGASLSELLRGGITRSERAGARVGVRPARAGLDRSDDLGDAEIDDARLPPAPFCGLEKHVSGWLEIAVRDAGGVRVLDAGEERREESPSLVERHRRASSAREHLAESGPAAPLMTR